MCPIFYQIGFGDLRSRRPLKDLRHVGVVEICDVRLLSFNSATQFFHSGLNLRYGFIITDVDARVSLSHHCGRIIEETGVSDECVVRVNFIGPYNGHQMYLW